MTWYKHETKYTDLDILRKAESLYQNLTDVKNTKIETDDSGQFYELWVEY